MGGTPAEAWTPREALRAEPTLAPMVEALDRAMSDTALHDELAKKLAAWEAKNFHQDQANRGEKAGLGARRRRQVGDDGDPAAVGDRGPRDRRRGLVPARGDRARGVGGRRPGAVAGRGRRLRRHLLERRARRRDRRGDAAVLVGAPALHGPRPAGEGRPQRARGARVRSLRQRRVRRRARADEPAAGGAVERRRRGARAAGGDLVVQGRTQAEARGRRLEHAAQAARHRRPHQPDRAVERAGRALRGAADRGRHLVPGREQRRTRGPVPHAVPADDPRLARGLERSEAAVSLRAATELRGEAAEAAARARARGRSCARRRRWRCASRGRRWR